MREGGRFRGDGGGTGGGGACCGDIFFFIFLIFLHEGKKTRILVWSEIRCSAMLCRFGTIIVKESKESTLIYILGMWWGSGVG